MSVMDLEQDIEEGYTANDITWRAWAFVDDQPVGYTAKLGFRSGFGGMLNLEVFLHDGLWYASIEGHRKFATVEGAPTVAEAQLAAISLAAQALRELATELACLVENMNSVASAALPTSQMPRRRSGLRRLDRRKQIV